MLKTSKTPYRSISIITLDPAGSSEKSRQTNSRTSETIFTGQAIFVRSGGGNWHKIGAEVGALQELVRKASSKLERCQDLGSDTLGGASTMVFSADEGSKTYKAATKQWVEKDRGILVRSETNSTTKDGSRHSVIEYRYDDVTAPQL